MADRQQRPPDALSRRSVNGIVARSASHLALPVPKALWYMMPPASRARRDSHADASVPMPRRSPVVAAHVASDEFARTVFALGRMRAALNSHSAIGAETRDALVLFEERGWLAEPRSYHCEPVLAVEPKLREAADGWEVMTFPSEFVPDPEEPGAERWNGYVPNRQASAYVLRRPGPRPWVVMVHGMMMGRHSIDRKIFRADYLHHQLGLNVALPILPLHGTRRVHVRPRPALPTPDTMDNIHGLAQAALDVRTVLAWIRQQAPTGLGMMGMSLGGYVTSLVAGLEPALDCVIAGIPAVDFPTVIAAHTPRAVRRTAWHKLQLEDAKTLHRVVSPLEFTPATPIDRRFIYAGTADRVLDPVVHGGALWEHWGRPKIFWFDGGHVAHVRGADVREFTVDALRSTGLVH